MSNAANKLLLAAAGNAGDDPVYVEDVFSTFLYTGNASGRGIPNGINLGNFGVGTSTEFDGTNDYLTKSFDDDAFGSGSKTFTFSAWFFWSGNESQTIFQYPTFFVSCNQPSGNVLTISGYSNSYSTILGYQTSAALVKDSWNHVLVSMDLSNSSNRHVYINDVSDSGTYPNYSDTNIGFDVGGTATISSASAKFDGRFAHIYLDYTYRDFSVESNRRNFIDANGGSTSVSTLTALSPPLYLPMTDAYAVGKNVGSLGDFSAVGSPTIVQSGTEYVADSGKGGMVWIKARTKDDYWRLYDSERASINAASFAKPALITNTTGANANYQDGVVRFDFDGFLIDDKSGTGSYNIVNTNNEDYLSWTFRKQEGFFDVVTYTGDGNAGRTVNHNLGSVPGFMIVKKLNSTSDFTTYHRSMGATKYAPLNDTDAYGAGSAIWNNTAPTSTQFTVGDNSRMNNNGDTYVAYLFAHDEQDFGEDSDEAIIKCDSYTGNGSTTSNDIDVGFEPQWVLIKNTTSNNQWYVFDVMRGIVSEPGGDAYVLANDNGVEVSSENYIDILPNGFSLRDDNATVNANGSTYIYVAIRRPHKPASELAATDLFKVNNPDTAGDDAFESGFPVDMAIRRFVNVSDGPYLAARLSGPEYMLTSGKASKVSDASSVFDNNEGWASGWSSNTNHFSWMWKRAPGFFDVVAYTGTGGSVWHNHNLGVVPEMIICKGRDIAEYWNVFTTAGGTSSRLHLDEGNEYITNDANQFFPSLPTATQFRIGQNNEIGGSGYNYMAYLFASVAGISKLGTYTGTGSAQDIDCGFSAGARFVMIKRVDVAGYWIVWDSVRGIVAGNDPYLFFNTTAAQVTNTDYIDPLSSGFTITSSAPTDNSDGSMNKSGGTYFFYAIA